MQHIEIYPLDFAPVAYLCALYCMFSGFNPRFWFSAIWGDYRV